MAYINGYAYLVGLIAVVVTLAFTSSTFIFNIANTLNIVQIESQGAIVGLYIGLIIASTLYNLLGLRFSAYLNKFMGMYSRVNNYYKCIADVHILLILPSCLGSHWYCCYYCCYSCYGSLS